jgi:hypothetical protein
MKIQVRGCVHKQADFLLPPRSTVADALKIAGGLGREGWEGTGIVTVRSQRKADGRYYCRRRLHAGQDDLSGTELRHMDLVVAQYRIEEET